MGGPGPGQGGFVNFGGPPTVNGIHGQPVSPLSFIVGASHSDEAFPIGSG